MREGNVLSNFGLVTDLENNQTTEISRVNMCSMVDVTGLTWSFSTCSAQIPYIQFKAKNGPFSEGKANKSTMRRFRLRSAAFGCVRPHPWSSNRSSHKISLVNTSWGFHAVV